MNISRARGFRLHQWTRNRQLITCRMSMSGVAKHGAPLRFADGPLVWVDCEMTGLDPDKDKILGNA